MTAEVITYSDPRTALQIRNFCNSLSIKNQSICSPGLLFNICCFCHQRLTFMTELN